VTSDQPQLFKLTSTNLIFLSQKRRYFLNDVTWIVNEKSFSINSSLFGCISDSYLNNSTLLSQQKFSLSEKEFSCFISFLNIFKGFKFPIHQYQDCLQSFISRFGLSCLISFLPFPQIVSQAIIFLSFPSCEQFESHFLQSISILIQNFDSLTIDQLSCLSHPAFEQIFRPINFKLRMKIICLI
jgi:hypothetical protein